MNYYGYTDLIQYGMVHINVTTLQIDDVNANVICSTLLLITNIDSGTDLGNTE